MARFGDLEAAIMDVVWAAGAPVRVREVSEQLNHDRPLAFNVAGAAGARAWYVALNRGKVEGLPSQGLCIQGFIVAAGAVLVTGLALAGLPVRTFLDISAPGCSSAWRSAGRDASCTAAAWGGRRPHGGASGPPTAVLVPAGRRPSSWSRWRAWPSGWPRCSLSCKPGRLSPGPSSSAPSRRTRCAGSSFSPSARSRGGRPSGGARP
jgi:hypothetical protein